MPLLAVNVRTTTLAIQQVVGTQSEDGPSPGTPPWQGFAFRLARRLVLQQAQHVVQYAAGALFPIDKDKYI